MITIPKKKENIPGTKVIKFIENPDKLIGIISLFFINFTQKKIPAKRNINEDELIIKVGDFIKVKSNIFNKKLSLTSFS